MAVPVDGYEKYGFVQGTQKQRHQFREQRRVTSRTYVRQARLQWRE